MSGISPNKCKKNGKKCKSTTSEVSQSKSMKLDGGAQKSNLKINAKSVDCLRKQGSSGGIRKLFNFNKNQSTGGDVTDELESGIVKKIKKLSLKSDGESNCVPSTSRDKVDDDDNPENKLMPRPDGEEETCNCKDNVGTGSDPKVGGEEHREDDGDDVGDYAYSCHFYHKNSKSIKFTNQVTVLYFNGEDVLCESLEPLKKEIDQQVRNKEMRKEHLLKAGQEVDNLYLF